MSKHTNVLAGIFIALVVIGGSFVGGAAYGYQNRSDIEFVTELSGKEVDKPSEIDFGTFWKVWRLLQERYVPVAATSSAAAVTADEKVWGAIQGLVESYGDPYTVFMPPQEHKMFEEEVSGRFGGVGMEVGVRDRKLTVIAPLPNTPAEKAGLKAGDHVFAIEGEPTASMSVNKAISLIRGDVGTKVALTIVRELEGELPETFDVEITRQRIEVPTIDTELLPEKVFLIKLYNFGGTAQSQFRQALREFVAAKTDKLIIDLRGNPGGYLDAAIDVAGLFLPKDAVIVREERKGAEPKIYKNHDDPVFSDKLKLAILVDGGSASASEIVAGALREHGVATLIGEKTFGKGSVQEVIPVTRDTSLKVTVARWLTPKGVSISHDGLTPDLVVKAATSTDETLDPQLDAAVELLTKKR